MANILQHLKERRLDPTLYGAVLASDTVTFPLWNLSGQMVGYQQYTPDAPKSSSKNRDSKNPREKRYFTYMSKQGGDVTKPVAYLTAFGLDRLDNTQKFVFLAEGVFDVSPLHIRGINALATLTNNPKPLARWLRSLGYTLIALVEGDRAGKKLAKFADLVIELPDNRDPGDMPDSWFDALVTLTKERD